MLLAVNTNTSFYVEVEHELENQVVSHLKSCIQIATKLIAKAINLIILAYWGSKVLGFVLLMKISVLSS